MGKAECNFTWKEWGKSCIFCFAVLWKSDSKSIVAALQRLEETNNLYFLNEIDIKKIVNDKDIKEQFLKLKFTPGVEFKWSLIKQHDFDKCLEGMTLLSDIKCDNVKVSFVNGIAVASAVVIFNGQITKPIEIDYFSKEIFVSRASKF